MAKDPAVLFYTSDFLTGTAFFTDEQRGQYIRLLCEQHQNGRIPENHMVSVCFSLDSPVVKKFVKDDQGNYYNERMEEEIIKRREFTESRRNNGKLGGRPKASDKPKGKASDEANKNLGENGNDNGNIDKDGSEKESQPEFKFADFIKLFNQLTNRSFKGDKKAERQFRARVKEGYEVDEFTKAITNLYKNDYHKETGFEHATPEFITRSDKLQKYLNTDEKNKGYYAGRQKTVAEKGGNANTKW